ncbi:hypothetical protein KAI10_00080, partial [Candidatus Bathyarchaeota archaeon]|nr:hypothetical protein [Candidatus Bathyarchaeota archaeon]
MIKKVTIITPPEYEGLVLESLGRARVTQLTHVTGSEFEGLEAPAEQTVDYKELYQRVQTRLVEPLGLSEKKLERVTPSLEELREFARDPVGVVDSLVIEARSVITKVNEVKESVQATNNNLTSELHKKIEVEIAELEDAKSGLIENLENIDADKVAKFNENLGLKVRLDSITALEPKELKSCFAVGIVKSDFIPQMKEYLKRYPDTYSKVSEISKDESLLFVFGAEESQKWVDALFLVYDIKDIYDVLDPVDVLLVLDLDKRDKAIKNYKKQLAELEKKSVAPEDETPDEKKLREKIAALDAESEKRVADLKDEYANKIKVNEETLKVEQEKVQEEQMSSVNKVDYYSNVLKMYSKKNAPVLRGKIISVLQGYTPERMVSDLRKAIGEVESQIGETLYVEVSDLGEGDEHAPVPEIDFKSDKLQPLWILTRL